MRAVLFTLMLVAVSAMASTTPIYKWVDENGVTHYSDQPHPGAQKIQVQEAQTYKAAVGPRTPSAPPPRARSSAPAYSACVVSRPTSEEMFQNTQTIPASVHVEPNLRPGDRVSVLLDGAPVMSDVQMDSEFALNSVYRGAHSLAVKIEDSAGAVVCQSASVPFNVRQASVLAPNSPLAPPSTEAPATPVAPTTPILRPR
jgi:2-oxoglutarate dehydrogenase complex dehydrogenase (E1) component-like enzyme